MTSIELAHPHDHLARRFLIDPELMADLLAYYTRKVADKQTVGLLDLKHLECKSPVAIDQNLIEGIGDLRFATTFRGSNRQSNVYLIFEHQSKIDQRIRIRGLNYIIQSYNQFEEAHKGKGKLPYPIVVVLYHGKASWKSLPDMDDMIDIVPGAESGLLKFTLILIDISVIPPEEFEGHPALRALLETLQRSSEGELLANFDRITDYFRSIKRDPRAKSWLHSIVHYTMSVVEIGSELIVKAYSKVFNEREAQKMAMTTAQKLLLEGKAEGKAEGERQAILTVLNTRFGKVPPRIAKSVDSYTDHGALKSLTVLAVKCNSLDEFREGVCQ
jgi:predicted transposase/invertase (TIGR01784 family)